MTIQQWSVCGGIRVFQQHSELSTLILGGIVIFIPTYYMVFTSNWLSRTSYGTKGAFEHQHLRASDEIGRHLIRR
jgi:hypothetical protein